MHTDENNAIRYLMREMDPAEEIEFEKLMCEDEDLLIEVESLRATSRKLSALPKKNPPEQLSQSIENEVKQLQLNALSPPDYFTFVFKSGVAATILLAAISSGYYYYWGSSPQQVEEVEQVSNTAKNIDPWVDRNEIIRFTGEQPVSQSSTFQNDFTKSYEKLQLVNDPSGKNGENTGILLTGSSD